MQGYTSAFKALAEPTRLRIVALFLRAQKELCVCELVDALEEPQYHVSRSLKILQAAGLLKERPDGKWVYYALPPAPDDFQQFLLRAIAALPDETFDRDQRELKRRLKLREGGKCLSGVRKIHLLSRKP